MDAACGPTLTRPSREHSLPLLRAAADGAHGRRRRIACLKSVQRTLLSGLHPPINRQRHPPLSTSTIFSVQRTAMTSTPQCMSQSSKSGAAARSTPCGGVAAKQHAFTGDGRHKGIHACRPARRPSAARTGTSVGQACVSSSPLLLWLPPYLPQLPTATAAPTLPASPPLSEAWIMGRGDGGGVEASRQAGRLLAQMHNQRAYRYCRYQPN